MRAVLHDDGTAESGAGTHGVESDQVARRGRPRRRSGEVRRWPTSCRRPQMAGGGEARRCRGRSSMLRIEERSRGTKSEQLNQASPQASYRPPVVRTTICQPYEGVSSESISCIIHYTKLTPAMVRQQFSHAGGQNDATTREAV